MREHTTPLDFNTACGRLNRFVDALAFARKIPVTTTIALDSPTSMEAQGSTKSIFGMAKALQLYLWTMTPLPTPTSSSLHSLFRNWNRR
jgi:hypothetical protein